MSHRLNKRHVESGIQKLREICKGVKVNTRRIGESIYYMSDFRLMASIEVTRDGLRLNDVERGESWRIPFV